MGINIWILVVFAVASAVYVWRDARRTMNEDAGDWDDTPPNPLTWTLLTLLLAPIALPAYAARGKRPVALMASIVVALAALGGSLLAPETHHLDSPFSGGKAVPWSKFPPGLSPAVRKATEALPVDLATRVVDLLPGLVALGRSFPGGATLDVKPGVGEARILATVNVPGRRVLVAPPARDGAVKQLKIEVLERIAPDVIVHTLVVEGTSPKVKVDGPEGPRGEAIERLALDVASGVYKVLHVDAVPATP
jgi:hypothetical protein